MCCAPHLEVHVVRAVVRALVGAPEAVAAIALLLLFILVIKLRPLLLQACAQGFRSLGHCAAKGPVASMLLEVPVRPYPACPGRVGRTSEPGISLQVSAVSALKSALQPVPSLSETSSGKVKPLQNDSDHGNILLDQLGKIALSRIGVPQYVEQQGLL